MLSVCTVLAAVVAVALGRAGITNNGYNDIVVAISPDVPQDNAIIDQIKSKISDASRDLYKASRNRVYFRNVTILLPKTWSYPDAVPLDGESFETAEFRIDNPNSVYGDAPYTLQTTDCGVPGSYIHLTPGYLADGNAWGIPGKALTHEFAKLRWGVFEEHGYTNDDKFPMFYLKQSWTIDGQKSTVTPNFCVNGELRGWEQDISNGGPCKTLPSGLPDGNCAYYATQESKPTTSYMALPYLTSVTDFCDTSEALYHDPDLPNKQNLFCNGKSTWEVIMESEDFKDGANQPDNTITDPAPSYTIVGGESKSSVDYVIVMDISRSMADASRFIPMKDAAKRWISYEVEDGVKLGLVFFNDKTNETGFDLTEVSTGSKKSIIDIIDKVEAVGTTCISGGLLKALMDEAQLNKTSGNVIILLTDGKQEGTGCPVSIIAVANKLAEFKTRVITIALGDEADPEIEDLAEITGGKSFYVADNSGPGDFNDAFSGSSTYQPGDTLGNTTLTVHEKAWTNVSQTAVLKGLFEVDSTIGRDLTFRVEITKSKKAAEDCSSELLIKLAAPDQTRTNITYKCSQKDFGIYSHPIPEGTGVSGRWIYTIESSEHLDALSVRVTSKSKAGNDEPIWSRCWINTGSQSLDEDVALKLSAMAEVKQGNMPIIGAKVIAYIERPQTAGETSPPLEIELMDNGAGADSIKNDGIYTRYFGQYSGAGRYSVKCEVTGQDGTQVNEGFIESRAIPAQNGTRMCCGSDTVFPDSKLTNTGNFSRQAAAGSFQSKSNVTGDQLPPSRVLDLQISESCGPVTLRFTSPGDNLDSPDPVQEYVVKYAVTTGNLTQTTFTTGDNENVYAGDVTEGDLNPVKGGTVKEFTISSDSFSEGQVYYFALNAKDGANNTSPVSNIVSAIPKCSIASASFLSLWTLVILVIAKFM